jgi:hypothetical protein
MHTRIAIAGLWFLAAAYAGSILHAIVGIDPVVGPLVGSLSAALIIGAPLARGVGDRVAVAAKPESRSPDALSKPA